MQHGEDRRQTHRHEHGRAERSPFGRAKLREDRDGDTAQPNGADHGPVRTLEIRHAVEAIVDTGYEAADNQANDTDVIERVPDARNERRVVRDRMVGSRHTQTKRSAGEKAPESEDICLSGCLVARFQGTVEEDGGGDGHERREEVAVDIDGLIVQVGKGLEGEQEGE